MLTYAYKTQNEDFRVNEILNVVLDGGIYHYYILCKSGLRTVDVIDKISENYNVALSDITYAGLKDEDAVTMQYIAIKNRIIENHSNYFEGKKYSLSYVGASDFPIEIGRLQGNSFKIRLRNLELIIAQKIQGWERHVFPIINYFDVQRFGMPRKPKLTYRIGECLIQQHHDEAFKFLFDSGNIDKETFYHWKNNGKSYFDAMEIRRKSFYLSSSDSFEWNCNVKNILQRKGGVFDCEKEGIHFGYVSNLTDSIRKELDCMPIVWHRYNNDGNIYLKKSFRQPYIDIIYRSSEIMQDDYYCGKYMVDIDFVLPAGAYATNAIDQLMYILGQR